MWRLHFLTDEIFLTMPKKLKFEPFLLVQNRLCKVLQFNDRDTVKLTYVSELCSATTEM